MISFTFDSHLISSSLSKCWQIAAKNRTWWPLCRNRAAQMRFVINSWQDGKGTRGLLFGWQVQLSNVCSLVGSWGTSPSYLKSNTKKPLCVGCDRVYLNTNVQKKIKIHIVNHLQLSIWSYNLDAGYVHTYLSNESTSAYMLMLLWLTCQKQKPPISAVSWCSHLDRKKEGIRNSSPSVISRNRTQCVPVLDQNTTNEAQKNHVHGQTAWIMKKKKRNNPTIAPRGVIYWTKSHETFWEKCWKINLCSSETIIRLNHLFLILFCVYSHVQTLVPPLFFSMKAS